MIVIKYTKCDGAEFISHLDLLRHIGRSFKRAKLDIKYSLGYNPHMLIYMSAPMGVGLRSKAEYATIEIDGDLTNFVERFNEFSPKGIKCLDYKVYEKNPNLQGNIVSAIYEIEGVNIELEKILESKTFTIEDKKGERQEVRDKIINIEKCGDKYLVELAFGQVNLRIDRFIKALQNDFGLGEAEFVKTGVYILIDGCKQLLF